MVVVGTPIREIIKFLLTKLISNNTTQPLYSRVAYSWAWRFAGSRNCRTVVWCL